VTKTGAQLAANILLSRPLATAGVAPVLLPVCSRLAPVLVSVAVAVGTPITSRMTPVMAEV
jgi:hypothetical protein